MGIKIQEYVSHAVAVTLVTHFTRKRTNSADRGGLRGVIIEGRFLENCETKVGRKRR